MCSLRVCNTSDESSAWPLDRKLFTAKLLARRKAGRGRQASRRDARQRWQTFEYAVSTIIDVHVQRAHTRPPSIHRTRGDHNRRFRDSRQPEPNIAWPSCPVPSPRPFPTLKYTRPVTGLLTSQVGEHGASWRTGQDGESALV